MWNKTKLVAEGDGKDPQGKLVIISGPSGSGKTTICLELTKNPRVRKSISVTTRPPRAQERQGRDYYFVTEEEFYKRLKEGRFAEYARYAGYLYGTLLEPLEKALEEGLVYLLEIDVQGARQIQERFPQAVSIFIVPPDEITLERRLTGRGTNKEEDLGARLEIAREELMVSTQYKYLVVNDKLERAVEEIGNILGLNQKVT